MSSSLSILDYYVPDKKMTVKRKTNYLINKIVSPGTTFARTGQAYDNKSGQWLGSLVASSGEDGTVMVGTY